MWFTEFRPFLVLIISAAIDVAISNGYLTPDQKATWVDGVLTIVGSVGTVIAVSITLWHEFAKSHKMVEPPVQQVTVQTPASSNVTYNLPGKTAL